VQESRGVLPQAMSRIRPRRRASGIKRLACPARRRARNPSSRPLPLVTPMASCLALLTRRPQSGFLVPPGSGGVPEPRLRSGLCGCLQSAARAIGCLNHDGRNRSCSFDLIRHEQQDIMIAVDRDLITIRVALTDQVEFGLSFRKEDELSRA